MAPPPDPPTTIVLRVKVPPGSIPGGADEFTLGSQVPVSANIGQVRERIQRLVPSSPAPESQRLLYGGKALVDNEQTLSDALNVRRDPSQEEYVIHLVVRSDASTSLRPSNLRDSNNSNRPTGDVPLPPNFPQNPDSQHLPRHMHQHQHVVNNITSLMEGQTQRQMRAHGQQAPATQSQNTAAQSTASTLDSHAQESQRPEQPDANRSREQHFESNTPHPSNYPQRRPISSHGFHMEGFGPNGERITINHQNMAFPGPANMQIPRHPQLQGFPGPLPGMAQHYYGQDLNPFHVDRGEESANNGNLSEQNSQPPSDGSAPAPPYLGVNGYATMPPLSSHFGQNPAAWLHRAQTLRQQQQHPASSDNEVTCWLLSSPSGPRAILYSPQHGAFQGSVLSTQRQATANVSQAVSSESANTASRSAVPEQAGPNQAVPAQPAPPAQAQPAQAQAQAQAAEADPLGPLAPALNHLWLLLRILIFSYFLLGANMGWQRPLALMAIGLGFWLIRMGLLVEGAAVRRWWDAMMNDNQRGPQGQQGQGNGEGQQQHVPPRLRPGQMPTPEQVAQRLLGDQARARDDRLQRFRDYIRPVERAMALLVASLWPGVGEAYVRAREEEERRQAEEEIAARRREAEEQQRQEEEEKKKAEGGSGVEGRSEDNAGAPSDTRETAAATPINDS